MREDNAVFFRRGISLVLLAVAIHAQDKVEVEVQRLLVSVTDKGGNPVANVKRTDIHVREDGKERPLVIFGSMAKSPLYVAVAIDVSGSTINRPTFWQNPTIEFLKSTLRPRVDEAEVIHFASTVSRSQKLTSDATVLSQAIRQPAIAGGTALYDALIVAANDLRTATDRGVLVLISDGEDTTSRNSESAAIRTVIENGIIVYAIIVRPDTVRRTRGPEWMETLAADTGGMAFRVTREKDAAKAYETIQSQLASQYEVAILIDRSSKNTKLRKLRVDVDGKDLRVRYPAGYYANP
jgi:Ca-activated chloride channel family protein